MPDFIKKNRQKKQTTLKDIAEAVGVSVNTVSGVLNLRSVEVRVSTATRRAILTAARRLQYRRNVAASKLAGGKTRTLGILMPTLVNPFIAPIAAAFEQESVRLGYHCFMGCTQNDGLRKLEYVERFLAHGVDGLLLTTIWHDPDVEQALELLLSTDIPIVFIDYPWEAHPAPLISGNHFQGGQLLGRHLLETGHRRLAFFANETEHHFQSVKERIRGVRTMIQEAGLPESSLQILMGPSQRSKEYAAAAYQQIMEGKPTAVLAANDVNAISLMAGLGELGLQVPRDLAITGYDDLNHSFLTSIGFPDNSAYPWSIPITTVRQPLGEIGRVAAAKLVDQIQHGIIKEGEVHLLDVQLMARESSRLPERPL